MQRIERTWEYDDDGNETRSVVEDTYLATDGWWVTETTCIETAYDANGNAVRQVEMFGVTKADAITATPQHLHDQGERQ